MTWSPNKYMRLRIWLVGVGFGVLLLVIADLLILGPIERYATRWRTA